VSHPSHAAAERHHRPTRLTLTEAGDRIASPYPHAANPAICSHAHSFFKTLIDHEVTVELKNDIQLKGTLKSVDQYLNIKLDDISVVEELKYPHLVRHPTPPPPPPPRSRTPLLTCVILELGKERLHQRLRGPLCPLAGGVGGHAAPGGCYAER
jgi:small nuclear ribonucleoprotein (snRNP)-like protein